MEGPSALFWGHYINDIVSADYSNLFLTVKNVAIMNKELSKIIEWLHANKLSLNVNKTQYMIFSKKNNNITMHKSVTINNIILKKVENIKFLGVIVVLKIDLVHPGIAILCKARRLLKASTLITLYYSFKYPYFTYCIEVWGRTCDKYFCSKFRKELWGL